MAQRLTSLVSRVSKLQVELGEGTRMLEQEGASGAVSCM